MCDQRKNPNSCDGENWWGSNYGTGIDIVAPGVKIYATDISGAAGYNSGDYLSNFNGTSSACPNAAGVVALVLSVNSNLTQSQVRQILESKTDKISGYTFSSNVSGQPNGTWNSEVGYGRINACQAVTEAYKTLISISGASIICTSQTYQINNLPYWSTVTWTSNNPSGLSIDSTTGVATRMNNFNGPIILTATINGGCEVFSITKDVGVGNYHPIGVSSYNSNCSGGNFNYLNTSLSSACTANTPIYFSYRITDSNYSNFVFTPVSVPSGASWSSSGGNLYMTVYTPSSQGSRSATITMSATGPCGPYSVNFTSTAVNYYSSFFSISPNPSTENVTVSIDNESLLDNLTQDLIYAINITDHIGTPKRSFQYKEGIKSVDISLQDLRSGLYILSVFDGKIWSSERLIIQK